VARVFVSGSSTGLGLLACTWLAARGHQVTLHARNAERTADLRAALPHAPLVLGDLSKIDDMRRVADQVNALGRHDAVIHNAAVYRVPDRVQTDDGLSLTFAVNVLAPYLLTALIERPDRIVYMTSTTHSGPATGGTGCRRTPTASSSTRCWRWASLGAGPRSGRTR
jgi:NAD(P)-dependent dehydrogenase (short-subunit alcohol dehydrogenase family)